MTDFPTPYSSLSSLGATRSAREVEGGQTDLGRIDLVPANRTWVAAIGVLLVIIGAALFTWWLIVPGIALFSMEMVRWRRRGAALRRASLAADSVPTSSETLD